jgi:hypothetical protein
LHVNNLIHRHLKLDNLNIIIYDPPQAVIINFSQTVRNNIINPTPGKIDTITGIIHRSAYLYRMYIGVGGRQAFSAVAGCARNPPFKWVCRGSNAYE